MWNSSFKNKLTCSSVMASGWGRVAAGGGAVVLVLFLMVILVAAIVASPFGDRKSVV